MTCSNSANISFVFRDDSGTTYLEIRPRSMQFDRTRGKFDFCKAEFSQEVADHIRPIVKDENSFLRQPVSVLLTIDGEDIYRLLWTPDGVRFGQDNVHIDFQDPQKFLTRGKVDWRRENVKLREAYEHVFDRRQENGAAIFNDIRFADSEAEYNELLGRRSGLDIKDVGFSDTIDDFLFTEDSEYKPNDHETEAGNIQRVINGHYAIDFDKISPWECITKLNQKFGVETWAGPDGNFWVGSRAKTGMRHIATPDDRRVWKLSEYEINETRDPVTESVVRGRWADDPNESYVENKYAEIETLNIGTDEFRVEGVAETKSNSILGQRIVSEVDAKRDALEGIAELKLKKKQRDQQNGYIDILPEFSGTEQSDIRHVAIGDTVLTIPPNADSDVSSTCNTNIETELFDVVGVQHELTSDGNWNIRLDVVKQLDGILSPDNIETKIRYYDPSDKQYIEEDEYGNDWEGIFPDF